MRIRHVALYRWVPDLPADHIERVRDAFDELGARFPDVAHHHGSDLGVSGDGFDYVVIADFASIEQWRTYRDDPAHVLLVEELLHDAVAERAGGQFALTPGPGPTVAAPPLADESDEEMLERARRAAMAEMQALLADPDD